MLEATGSSLTLQNSHEKFYHTLGEQERLILIIGVGILPEIGRFLFGLTESLGLK